MCSNWVLWPTPHALIGCNYQHHRHEDEVIFKAINDLFPGQAQQFNDDHDDDRVRMASGTL